MAKHKLDVIDKHQDNANATVTTPAQLDRLVFQVRQERTEHPVCQVNVELQGLLVMLPLSLWIRLESAGNV